MKKGKSSQMAACFLACSLLALSWSGPSRVGAATGPSQDTAPSQREVVIRFRGAVGEKTFACGESYEQIGASRTTFTPTDFRFYVHNVRLLDEQGKEVPVALDQDNKWQYEDLALIDFENGTGPCSNGTAETNESIRGKVPAGKYAGLRFTVGVPFALNHRDVTSAPSPLNLTQLFWVWNSGYKFVRIEGEAPGLPNGFFLHLGSTACSPSETVNTVPTSCKNSNRPEVELAPFDIATDVVTADLRSLMEGVDLERKGSEKGRGCMSRPGDPQCRALFANLGLAFGDTPAAQQTFFHVEHAEQAAAAPADLQSYVWQLPEGFPRPHVPEDNPMTQAKVNLGRHLFYDTRLSVNGKMSCSTCHAQERAFTEAKARSVGTTGEAHPRNAMSLANVAYNATLTWANPNLKHLELQALVPLLGDRPVEMGMAGKDKQLLETLRADAKYQKLFAAAFPGDADPFTLDALTKAIACFVRSLISGNSPYDRYRYQGDANAISKSAKRGEKLFFSEEMECFHCHGGFNFSGPTTYEGKAIAELEFHNTGLYNVGGKGAYPDDNTGIYEHTQSKRDMGKFRAPTLRNIAVTAPYMHDGSIPTLDGVLDHYAAGGRTIRSGPFAGVGSQNPYKSAFVKGFVLTPQKRRDLINFLRSLTDDKFLNDSRFQNPWPSPQLRAGTAVRRGN